MRFSRLEAASRCFHEKERPLRGREAVYRVFQNNLAIFSDFHYHDWPPCWLQKRQPKPREGNLLHLSFAFETNHSVRSYIKYIPCNARKQSKDLDNHNHHFNLNVFRIRKLFVLFHLFFPFLVADNKLYQDLQGAKKCGSQKDKTEHNHRELTKTIRGEQCVFLDLGNHR